MKLVQSFATLTLLLELGGELHHVQFPLLCPLQIVDRATGRCLLENLREQLHVPLLADVVKLAPLACHIAMADSAPANAACEEGGQAMQPEVWRLKLPCVAHAVSTVQGRAYAVVPDIISGITSASLVQKVGGSCKLFRDYLVQVLESVEIVHCPPPPLDAETSQYREALFDLCLPASSLSCLKRRRCLQMLLTGDLRGDCIQYHSLTACSKSAWANAVATLLLPGRIPVFQRLSASWVLFCCNVHSAWHFPPNICNIICSTLKAIFCEISLNCFVDLSDSELEWIPHSSDPTFQS